MKFYAACLFIAGLLILAGIILIDSRMDEGPSYEYQSGSGCPIDGVDD